jgi:cytochrome c
MPPHNLPGADLAALVAYVRSMAEDKTGIVKLGDSAKGKKLFENEGNCLNCHRVHGKGSTMALNLRYNSMRVLLVSSPPLKK